MSTATNQSSSNLRGRLSGLVLAFVLGVATMQTVSFVRQHHDSGRNNHNPLSSTVSITHPAYHYQELKPVLRNPKHQAQQCGFFLAKSAVAPNAGLGMFVGHGGLLPNDMVGFPDICLFVQNYPTKGIEHLMTHTWGGGMWFGNREGRTRIACEGYGTIFNTMPRSHINTKLRSAIQQTTAGATRDTPNAGSITHHYGMHGVALDVIPAGSELTIDYYDWDFDEREYRGKKRPERSLDDLEENGWCIDNIDIRQSTIEHSGRGAFSKRRLNQGQVVVPAPVEVFKDRAVFKNQRPEHLFVNYCLQPKNSKMLFYPYGPGVNLIQHSSKAPNVGLQWSSKEAHQAELLTMTYDQFWEHVRPGSLILEVVALRDLAPGEELFLDYGPTWEEAWKNHVASWKPPPGAANYTYPEDMDETEVLRTVKEQEQNPYPPNLITMCNTPGEMGRESKHMEWQESGEEWWWKLAFCHVLDRKMGSNGAHVYTVALIPHKNRQKALTEDDLRYDPSIPFQERYVDINVPRRAIHWVEKPNTDDEHLPNSFRQPIEMPDDLVALVWLNFGKR
mmetsp:Transcript_30075/g.82593  ORF Transcript_30075/g.82593 Transcript_30075/m.82593 type:complete len:561 (+) Transcript_30075:80-1762(+)